MEDPAVEEEKVDLSYLLSRMGFSPADLADVTVCPILDDYRRAAGIQHSEEGIVRRSRESLAAQTFNAPTFAFDEAVSDGGEPVPSENDDPTLEEDLVLPHNDDISEGKTSTEHEPRSSASSQELHLDSPTHQPKFNWNTVFGDDSQEAGVHKSSTMLEFDVSKGLTNADNFSFYSMDAKGNDWAGARHWKFALRARAPKVKEPEPEVAKPLKAKKPKKERKPLEFSSDPIDESVFGGRVSKVNGHSLSASMLKKHADQAKQGALLLPPDAQLEIRDLCRLFLRPRMIVIPASLSLMLRQKESTARRKGLFTRDEDLFWGEAQMLENKDIRQNTFHPQDVDVEDRGEYFYEADEDFGETDARDASVNLEEIPEKPRGLEIRLSGMAQAGRRAQKIDISYATSAKRVNVGKLKRDLWKTLESTMVPKDTISTDPDEMVSFQKVITGLDTQQRQADATFPFYFICLLHLANEKVMHHHFFILH